MRAPWFPVCLVVVVMGLPAVAAVVPSAGMGSGSGAGSGAIPEATWLVPSFGYANHPVHVALATHDDGGAIGPSSFRVWVTMDDEVLFRSTQVHEHDGFHTLVITPPRTGALQFFASQLMDPAAAAHSVPVTATVPIKASDPHRLSGEAVTRIHPTFHQIEERHVAFMGNQHIGHEAFVDLVDADGRLILHTVPRSAGWHANFITAPAGGFGDGHIRATVTSFPSANHTVFTETITADLDHHEGLAARVHHPFVTDPLPACADTDVPILTDPVSAIEDGLAWQTWTDVRFALDTTDHLEAHDPEHLSGHSQPTGAKYAFYAFSPTAPVTGGGSHFMSYEPYDPFRQLTMRFREPGLYKMTVAPEARGTPACMLEFTILPNLEDDPGRVRGEVWVDGDTASARFEALRGTRPLSHYAFDTRVVRLHTDATPGALVWQGKLHAREGYVEFTVGGLRPGDHEVRTYPSPQAPDDPPLAAEGGDGFVYRFTVAGPPEAEAVVTPAPTATTPGPPVLVAVLAALAGLALLGRRRTA